MKRLACVFMLAACSDPLPARWELDRERIVAVRAEPPSIAAGQIARLDALVAHPGAPVDVEPPNLATAAGAPGDLYTAVHYDIDHWQVEAPDEAALAAARAALHLPADAPVPLEVTLFFPAAAAGDRLLARKLVYLGDAAVNPTVALAIGGEVPVTDELTLPRGTVTLDATAAAVRWSSSCGTLADDASPSTTLDVQHDGQLVVVVHDDAGGVAWRVLTIHAR